MSRGFRSNEQAMRIAELLAKTNGNEDKIIGFIYETNDYGKFKRLEANRVVDHYEAIAKSIKDDGYTLSPICVNENVEIIDGQNREVALEELGMPVHYYIAEGATIDNCIAMNIGQQNWKPEDFVNSYAERGIDEYVFLKETKDKHPTLSYNIILLAVNGGGDQGGVNKRIKTGNIAFHEPTYRNELTLEFLEDIQPYVKKSAFPTRTMAALTLLDVRGLIDKNRMLKQFKDYSLCERFNAVPNREVVYAIQELYNYNRRNCVFFADEYKRISIENNAATAAKYK